jgi:hypothetical protein
MTIMRYRKLLLTMLGVVVALATGASLSAARRFEISETHIGSEFLTLNWLEELGEIIVSCHATITGTFHSRTISKMCGQLIGYITGARFGQPCINGNGFVLNGTEKQNEIVLPNRLPWHVRYDSFRGTLPRITGIRVQIIGASFLLEPGEISGCLYRSEPAKPLYAIFEIEANGKITGLRLDETKAIPRVAGLCLAIPEIRPQGTGGVSVLERTTAITVRLVQ